MTNDYQCTGCGVVISADPELTPTAQCNTCSTILSLGPPVSPGDQNAPAASTYMDYQCPGCGATNSADPTSTPEVHCNTCLTPIKLGQAYPQEIQRPQAGPSIPELGAVSKTGMPEPENPPKSEFPELGAAPKGGLPQLGGAVKKDLPELGAAVKKGLPELGAAVKSELSDSNSSANSKVPEPRSAIKDEFPASGNVSGKELPVPGSVERPALAQESGIAETAPTQTSGIETSIKLSDPAAEQRAEKVRPAWMNFLLQPRVMAAVLGVAPVMITVIVGAILSFIRCGTGIAGGEGDVVMQGGEIVLGLAALWAMYILGMTYYFADRDWVTDFGHFVMIGGGIWGLYAVATTFPSTFLAIMGHLFLAYIAVAAIALAVWLLAPYKGIGSPR